MRFPRISISTSSAVELDVVVKYQNGFQESKKCEGTDPPPAFVKALQAFKKVVARTFAGAISFNESDVTITTLNLSFDKHGGRGLVVTAIVPLPRANDRPLVLNTPLLREGVASEEDPDTVMLGARELALIAAVEEHATRYVTEQQAQGELFPTVATEDESASANGNGAETPKPKRRRKDFVPGVGEVANPDATVAPTDKTLHALLLEAGRDVPLDAIAEWASSERAQAQRWGAAVLRARAGDQTADSVPKEPECVVRSATPALIEA